VLATRPQFLTPNSTTLTPVQRPVPFDVRPTKGDRQPEKNNRKNSSLPPLDSYTTIIIVKKEKKFGKIQNY